MNVHNEMQRLFASAVDANIAYGDIKGELADEVARTEAVQATKEQVAEALADGKLTSDEFGAILRELKALGIDTSDLESRFSEVAGRDGVVDASAPGGNELRKLLGATLGDLQAATRLNLSDLTFRLQRAQTQEAQTIGAISTLRKMKHNAALNIIGNLKA